METRKSVLGPEHLSTLISMANLAHIWKGQCREEEAVALLNECVQLTDRVCDPEHPFTSSSRAALVEWETGNVAMHINLVTNYMIFFANSVFIVNDC
jgi:hypothetical protein